MAEKAVPISKAKGRLTTAITTGATTISFTPTDSTRVLTDVVLSNFGDVGYITINPSGNASNYAIVKFESWSVSGSTITLGTLTWKALQGTGDSTLKEFPAGTTVIVSTNHQWFDHVVQLNGDQTISGVKTFESFSITPSSAPSTDYQIANKKYVDDTASSGASDASTTVKGLVEIATDAELAAGTGTGGTGAVLSPAGSSFNQTAAAGKVPVAEATGKIGEDWLGLSTAGDIVYSDGTDLQRLPIGTAEQLLKTNAGATAPEWATIFTLPTSPTQDDFAYYNGSVWTNTNIAEYLGVNSAKSYYDVTGSPLNESTNSNSFVDSYGLGGLITATYSAGTSSASRGALLSGATPTNAWEMHFRAKFTNTTDAADRGARVGFATQVDALHRPDAMAGSHSGATIRYTNGTLSCTSRAAGSEESNTITGITASDYNDYSIIWNTTDIKFYVNGALKFTHTSQLPESDWDILGWGAADESSSTTVGITVNVSKFMFGITN